MQTSLVLQTRSNDTQTKKLTLFPIESILFAFLDEDEEENDDVDDEQIVLKSHIFSHLIENTCPDDIFYIVLQPLR